MSDAIVTQGTKLEISGTAGGAVSTVTAAVGNPTIITKSSHGLLNGDIVTLSAFAGASADLMNTMVVIVKYVTTNTLAVDINTTGGTLTAANGTLTPLAWVEVVECIDHNRADAGAAEIDVTHLGSTAKEFLIGLPDYGSYDFSYNWVVDDPGQAALITAKDAQTLKNFKITYSDDSTATFAGYVKTVSGPVVGVDSKLTGSASIKITGAVTFTP